MAFFSRKLSFSSLITLTVIFQFQLLSSWGDPYYIGLTGLELYDEHGERIPLSQNSILSSRSRSWGNSEVEAGRFL